MKPCIFCKKEMTNSVPENHVVLPEAGGEIQFIFCKGSKFHTCRSVTQYSAIICDTCAEEYLPEMIKTCELW